jgi:photosystem II stability/assembly factor-like uncharacterized protein
MKNIVCLLVIFLLVLSCTSDKKIVSNPRYTKISIDTIMNEKMSSRAIIIDQNRVWYGANNGNYGYVSLDTLPDFKGNIAKENLKLEFRSIAQTSKAVFILSVGNPALLYRINKKTSEIKLVYQEKHEKVFYDSMQFFNDTDGFALGDPTQEGCPSLIKTTDGGEKWLKIDCNQLPKFAEGEAFFAASNSNLILKEDTLWMVSGGKKAKVYRSLDNAQTWQAFETPIVQGESMTGIFSADFYDDDKGIIVGGNYEKLDSNKQNKAITNDGGKTWELISDNEAFGYASCVQYLPNSGGKSMVCIGPSGLFYYRKKDKRWKQLSNDKDFYTLRFIDNNTAIAAGKNKIVKISFR